MSLSDALEAASERTKQEHDEKVRDRLVKYHADVYGSAAAYDNVVIIAGYAAFFALWAGAADDVSRICRLTTGALMGLSLLSYIAWTVLQMLVRQKFEHERAGLFEFANQPARFNAAWEALDNREAAATTKIMRLWLWLFVPALSLGFIAGCLLAYGAAAVVLGFPQL